jgi:hypothetical protein
MIILGVILLVIGFILGIHLLWTVGIVLAVAGVALALVGTRRPIAGRRHYW